MPKAKLTVKNESALELAAQIVETEIVEREYVGGYVKAIVSYKRTDDLFRMGMHYHEEINAVAKRQLPEKVEAKPEAKADESKDTNVPGKAKK